MALTDESGNMVMPVSPMGNNGGFGDMGGNGWWIILLFLLLGFGNNWNNGAGFGGNGVQEGFNQAAITSGLASIQNSINDVQGAICNGFSQAEIANNARQMSDMQQMFSMQSQLQQCCCDNRAGIESLRATIASENCADRQAVADGVQRILDQMCNDKIDAKNERIADLERQLTMANLAASQGAQTAAILANNEAQTTALEQYLAPTPRPAYIVQNPNCCPQNFGCGCGCAVG